MRGKSKASAWRGGGRLKEDSMRPTTACWISFGKCRYTLLYRNIECSTHRTYSSRSTRHLLASPYFPSGYNTSGVDASLHRLSKWQHVGMMLCFFIKYRFDAHSTSKLESSCKLLHWNAHPVGQYKNVRPHPRHAYILGSIYKKKKDSSA